MGNQMFYSLVSFLFDLKFEREGCKGKVGRGFLIFLMFSLYRF